MIKVGDKKIIKASSPNNTYHKFNGEQVEIIGVCEQKSSDPSYSKIYTFKHNQLGFGAMYEHGFK